MYVTASWLFRLERQATGALVVDSVTGWEAEDCETVGYQDVKKNRPARKETGAGRQREC